MPQTPSPLRYPGGKTSIRDLVAKIIKDNKLERGHYAEPYAGGWIARIELSNPSELESLLAPDKYKEKMSE